MSAGYLDQYMNQGATFNTTLTLDDYTGAALNLTGFSVHSQARRSYIAANATITFTSTISDAANGVITLSLDGATSANVPAGRLVYDVVITDPTGIKTRVLEGLLFVSPTATH